MLSFSRLNPMMDRGGVTIMPTDLGLASKRKRKTAQAQAQTETTIVFVLVIVSLVALMLMIADENLANTTIELIGHLGP